MTASTETKEPPRFRALHGTAGAIQTFLHVAIVTIAVLYILHMDSYLGFMIWTEQYLGILASLTLASLFINRPATKTGSRDTVPWYDFVLAFAGLVPGAYIAIFYPKLLILGLHATRETTTLGAVLILLVFEAVRRLMGWTLVIIVSIFIFYGAYAYLFPGFMYGTGMTWPKLLTQIYLDYTGFLQVFSIMNIIVTFSLFGFIFTSFGGGKVMIDLALCAFGRFRGAASKITVTACGVYGMISGDPVSNVIINGSVTIPMMKRTGYSSRDAGAIAAIAGTGGLLMPPVMGMTAFVMAEIVGVPYIDVAIAAAIPAVLYYFSLFAILDLEAGKNGLKRLPDSELPHLLPSLKKGWLFLFPVGVLVYTLFILQLPPQTAALYTAGFSLILLLILKENRIRFWHRFLDVVKEVGRIVMSLGPLFIVSGFILGAVAISGIGFKISLVLTSLAGSNLLILLILTAALTLLLGIPLPVLASYVLVAALVAPALVKMGIPVFAAHLFCLYYANLAVITPPVASSVFVAIALSGSPLMSTGWRAMELGYVLYIIPFFFVLCPSLLLAGPPLKILFTFAVTAVGMFALCVSLTGYLFSRIGWLMRTSVALGGFALLLSITEPLTSLAVELKLAGLLLFVPLGTSILRKPKSHPNLTKA